MADSCLEELCCANRRALIWYLLPFESTASKSAFEFPTCSQLNALQKRYSAKSPTGLFALRVKPLLRSSFMMSAYKAKRSYAGSFAISVIVELGITYYVIIPAPFIELKSSAVCGFIS